ncbi:MAG TPA: hypothetical protein VKU60_18535, partial [Chloroflexota bacterium]|nr:hypothetical protein [Chloroflexota bacterium]
EPRPGDVLLGRLRGQPDCMELPSQAKAAVFRLREGRLLGPEQASLDGQEGQPQLAPDETGTGEIDDDPLPAPKKDPLRRAAWYFEDARHKLQAEGSYAQRVSLWTPDQEWISMTLTAADMQDRYQLWGRVAREVERTGAQAVLTIFEMSGRRPGEGQRLVLAGETAEGSHRTFSAGLDRRGSQLRIGRTRFDEDGRRWYFLDPVREVWSTKREH